MTPTPTPAAEPNRAQYRLMAEDSAFMRDLLDKAGRVDLVRALHKPEARQFVLGPPFCPACHGSWPCDTARLVYTIDEMDRVLGNPEGAK